MKIRPTTILAVIVFLLGIMFDLNYAKYFIVLGMLVYFSVYRVYYIWNIIIEIFAVIAVVCTFLVKDNFISIYFLYAFLGLMFLDLVVIFIFKNLGYPILKSERDDSKKWFINAFRITYTSSKRRMTHGDEVVELG